MRTARAKGLSERRVLGAPRAAQRADPDRHAVRPRLRRGDRRRRDPHRVGLRPAGRRPVRGRVDRQPRPAADHGRRCSTARSSSCCSRRSWTSLYALPRPAGQAERSERARCSRSRTCTCRFATEDGVVQAVDGVSFDLTRGRDPRDRRRVGCGKSVTALTMMGLSRGPERARSTGTVRVRRHGAGDARATTSCARSAASEIAMVFQDPMTSLNPVYKVGDQIVEQIRAHEDVSKDEARERAVEVLRSVGIPDPEQRARQLPARVLGRHAPARDDRDGAVARAGRS